jgi:hypothetical protein
MAAPMQSGTLTQKIHRAPVHGGLGVASDRRVMHPSSEDCTRVACPVEYRTGSLRHAPGRGA